MAAARFSETPVLCCSMYCFVSTVLFYVLFVCKCVLYYCHRVSTQLQLNISYQISTKLHSLTFQKTITFVATIVSVLTASEQAPEQVVTV
jgi:hypothetical protein